MESICEIMDSDTAAHLNIPKLNIKNLDIDEISKEALKYGKLQDTNKVFTLEDISNIYKDCVIRNNKK